MLNILSNVETSLYEIEMLNHQYENIQLRNFPFGEILSSFELFVIMNQSCLMVIHNLDTKIDLS